VAILATLLAFFLPGWPARYTSPSEAATPAPAGREVAAGPPVPTH
jgi:hypothetical protein